MDTNGQGELEMFAAANTAVGPGLKEARSRSRHCSQLAREAPARPLPAPLAAQREAGPATRESPA
ncbi:hypothetical protein GCM10022226_07260 [Sphaerisporangium flaviroseum]|uniref:Uncharacterized protein n=1 Tax=Sphaerisporangium flaviroseum TaxID=509199 RepID=A0ABP7HK17_9ACTN